MSFKRGYTAVHVRIGIRKLICFLLHLLQAFSDQLYNNFRRDFSVEQFLIFHDSCLCEVTACATGSAVALFAYPIIPVAAPMYTVQM